MSHELKGLYKTGGISFIISGILFLLISALDFMLGSPPSTGEEILAWAASGEMNLAIINELMFFAAVFLIPGVIALYSNLANTARTRAAVSCGLFAVVIPIIFMLGIVHGRLMYPVYDIHINNPVVAEFIAAVYYGGLHAIYLLLGPAIIVISTAMKRVYGSGIAVLGIVAGVFYIIGSDPWLIGPILYLVCQILFAAWLIAVGAKLYRIR